MYENIGQQMYKWASDLFPICRSITGNGVRETLAYLKKILPDLRFYEVPSGTVAFDWEVPNEWNIKDAFVSDENGHRIIDFRKNNLHVVGYSEPVDQWMTFEEIDRHLYSLPDQPAAIPYVTSYYKRRWGFCITENQRKELRHNPKAKYHVHIDSTLIPGHLTYGELIIKGKTDNEILLSTYICHPSMANNELSGPVVATALAQWIKELNDRKYTYRILFLPETIGSIVYLSKHLEEMKLKTEAGFVLTCMGDNLSYSYLASRHGDTLADRAARHVLKYHTPNYKTYSFLERGADERQYCAPGVDLPVCSVMRTKYDEYAEYHTHLDDLSFISPEGLGGGYGVVLKCLEALEANEIYKISVLCEPQLGKRGLYPTLSTKESAKNTHNMMNFIAYCDGQHSLLDIADKIQVPIFELLPIVKKLNNANLLQKMKKT